MEKEQKLEIAEFQDNPNWRWRFLRKIAFNMDAELTHESALFFLGIWSRFINKNKNCDPIVRERKFAKQAFGLNFPNPVGMAAGFDVDAECIPALQYLGFGFIEVGGITAHAQPGNKKPRIFRLPKDQALINRLNFYNKGAHRLRQKLIDLRNKNKISVPIGVNLGKSNFGKLEDVPKEYVATFAIIHDVADYITINISCPNSHGLAQYQTAQSLGKLLDTICNFNEKQKKNTPILLKLGPDLTNQEAVAAAEIAVDYRLSGLIISNTTAKRPGLVSPKDFGPGGLSGKPLFERSTQLLRCVAKDYGQKLTIIGSGGIMDGAKAVAKFSAGADLIQIYTGFVYGGPNFVVELLGALSQAYDLVN